MRHESSKRKVVLVDDHHLIRAGLRHFIEYLPSYEVVGEGSDGDQIIPLLTESEPDILITDISMGRTSGLDALPEVKARFPHLKIIVLSMHGTKAIVVKALQAGASGYLVKESAESELELALDSVSAGQRYLSPQVAGEVFEDLFAQDEEARLTGRQREILRLIALGRSVKEIAYDLNVSNKTVEAHKAQLMERLQIRDIPNLVRYAIRAGIIDLDETL
ncbi:response regulator [Marinobacter sediminum]|uniref:response regulator n=1 Tax=Marinobacter sediminum TaxID=256323 RepID=UPI003569C9D1